MQTQKLEAHKHLTSPVNKLTFDEILEQDKILYSDSDKKAAATRQALDLTNAIVSAQKQSLRLRYKQLRNRKLMLQAWRTYFPESTLHKELYNPETTYHARVYSVANNPTAYSHIYNTYLHDADEQSKTMALHIAQDFQNLCLSTVKMLKEKQNRTSKLNKNKRRVLRKS